MHRYFTISNLLSASRIFLVIPMGYCLVLDFPSHRLWTAGIIVIAVATDFLDGFLARKLHQVTDLGKVLDPVADKIGIGIYAVLIAWTGDVPVWFVVFVLLRDLLIFSWWIIHTSSEKNYTAIQLARQNCCHTYWISFFLGYNSSWCTESPFHLYALRKCCYDVMVDGELCAEVIYWQEY